MKRVIGMLAVFAGVGAICGTHQSFATPSSASGQIFCVGRDATAIEPTFHYTSSDCWKIAVDPPGPIAIWDQYLTINLTLPVLYIGGQGAAPSGGGTYTGSWWVNHCPASGIVQNFLKTSAYNPPTVNSDTVERTVVLATFSDSFQVTAFDPAGVSAPKNQGDCCVQNGTFRSGLRRPTTTGSPPGGGTVCP